MEQEDTMMDKYKPRRIEQRFCPRHSAFPVPECPRCQQKIMTEVHLDGDRRLEVTVPVYRKVWKTNNKYKTQTKPQEVANDGNRT
jgi:hypothetical protein